MSAFRSLARLTSIVLALAVLGSCGVLQRSPDETPLEWTRAAPMPVPKDEFAIAVVDGRIYAVGGQTGPDATPLDDHQMYDPATDQWVRQPPLPEPRGAVRAAVIDDAIYVIGGSTRVDVFDTTTASWSQAASLPSPVLVPGVVVVDRSIYVFGGFLATGPRGGIPVDTVYMYNIDSDTWSQVTSMPMKRNHHAVAAVDGRIYIMGGNDGDGPLTTVEVYDPESNAWSMGSPLPEPMENFGAVAWSDEIRVLVHGSHHVYDPAKQVWSDAPPMTVPRHGFGAAVVDGELYVIGGCYQEPRYDRPDNETLALAG